jgi:D-alanyl-D-alanine carboxypeptidase
LSLEDKLSLYFPTLPNADKISIENLLSHRSGLHSFTDDSLYLTYYTKPKTQKELIDILAVTAPDFEPGKKTQYSNSNFVVLGFIAEKLTPKTYSQL